ncbi:MAG: hypothetical protein J2P15_23095, partial [Micromonosporaceae bacterium]|nr:hypothetical protein [Micromonosporaceae bacterium]
MHGSRFVFLSVPEFDEAGELARRSLTWMLISPNNRRLGQASRSFETFQECHAAVLRLREQHGNAYFPTVSVDERGHWAWRVDLDGETVAVSSRSYLRQQECDYNLRRFLEAISAAGVTQEIRPVRGGTAHAGP